MNSEVIQVQRILITLVVGFILIVLTGVIVGPKNKEKWFKKRTKYSLFTRRSVFGEFVHFGRPKTWEGAAILVGLSSVIFGGGYWFVFHY